MKNLGEVLRSWRAHRELSMREAARRIGVSAPTYCRLERGESDVSGPVLWVVLSWLIGE